MRVILVTGGTGFIGSHLLQQLAATGHTVRVLTRGGKAPATRPELAQLSHIEWYRADLLEALDDPGIWADVDQLYHLAGWISTRRRDAVKVDDLNHVATANLLQALIQRAEAGQVIRTVFLASIFALAGGSGTVDEDSCYNLGTAPVPYFLAKRKSELMFRKAAEEGLPVVFVYPCYCLGPGDVELSSSQLLWLMLRGLSPLVPAGGWNVMDVRDAAATLMAGMQKGQAGQRYIAGGVNQSFRDFARMVHKICGARKSYGVLPGALGRFSGRILETLQSEPLLDYQSAWISERSWFYDDSRARKELGHRSRPLEDTIREAAHWFHKDPHAPQPRPKLKQFK